MADVIVFHELDGSGRYKLLKQAWSGLSEYGEGVINSENVAMRECGFGLDTIPKTIESVTSYLHNCKRDRDIVLLLMPSVKNVFSVIIKTTDGLIFIGPNDGHLGFISEKNIAEIYRIAGTWQDFLSDDFLRILGGWIALGHSSWFLTDEFRLVFIAAKITAGHPWSEFGEVIGKDQLVRI